MAGPGAQTLVSEPKLPAADFVGPAEAGADVLLLWPPPGVEELERPQDVATTPRVAAVVTMASSFEVYIRVTGKGISTPSRLGR